MNKCGEWLVYPWIVTYYRINVSVHQLRERLSLLKVAATEEKEKKKQDIAASRQVSHPPSPSPPSHTYHSSLVTHHNLHFSGQGAAAVKDNRVCVPPSKGAEQRSHIEVSKTLIR